MGQILHVTSRSNARVKEARQIRDGNQREKIFIEGLRLVEEAVRSEMEIDTLFVTDESFQRASAMIDASGANEIYRLTDPAFRSIADTVTSQGILAIARRPSETRVAIDERIKRSGAPLIVFLHRANNPSNVGAVIRSAEAAGATCLIVSTGSADPFSPKALRGAMGSSFRLPIWTDVDLADAISWGAENNLKTVATAAAATRSYIDVDWRRPTMLLLGSEAHGLSETELEKVDERISIPMEGSVESLNLAVACGIVLFEAKRQRDAV